MIQLHNFGPNPSPRFKFVTLLGVAVSVRTGHRGRVDSGLKGTDRRCRCCCFLFIG
jgi:hypothetical protein